MGRELLQQQERWSATAIVAFTVLIGTFSEGEPMILSKDVWLGGSSYCGVSLKQGRRPHQEDRVICMPELLLPGPGVCFVKVGLFGVFDGHNGAEASEFASKYLPHLLHHHTRSIVMHGSNDFHGEVCLESDFAKWNLKDLYFPPLNGQFEQYTSIVNEGGMLVHCEDQQYHVSSYRAVLKEALARSLADIDSALLHSFSELGHQSGSTAVIVLNVNSSILVANIGDSQALICSPYIFTGSPARNISFPFQDDVQIMSTKELTVAHHPDRVDEKSRIEAAGGFVSTLGGVARVNGQLAISRALGDATFKKYGVIAEPEFFGWQQITADNSFLIVASDGIFEQMNPQDVCNLLQDHYEQLPGTNHHFAGVMIDYNALADTIVQAAYASGSFDNLAAVLYPLTSQSTGKHRTIKTLNSPATNEGISNKLSSSEQSSFCYELIDKVPNGVILSQRSSLNFLSSVSTDKTVNSNSLIKGLTDFNNAYKQIKGLAASVDIYREHLVCLAGPAFSDDDEVCLNSETFSNYLGLIEAVPMLESSSEVSNCEQFRSTNSNNLGAYKSIHMRYILTKNIGRGGFGEVWFAVMRNCTDAETMDKTHYEIIHDAHMKSYQLKNEMLHRLLLSIPKATKTDPPYDYVVLKRIMAEKGNAVYLSGLRERHFGQIFSNEMALKNSRSCPKMKLAEETEDGLKHIARYVESIEGSKSGDFWLVFVNEGYPLSSMLYSTDATFEEEKGHVRVLKPSKWWRWLRTTKAGKREMRSLMYQLILAVKACHDRNITHRDIKPENMMVRPTGMCLADQDSSEEHENFPCNLTMRIIDFGSAIDLYTLQNLYGSSGPTRYEETEEYSPPESTLQGNWWRVHGNQVNRYDLWSIGIVMLELILGTPHVFQIHDRTRALLDKHLEGWGSSALNTAYLLRAMMEMCILYPGKHGHHRPGAMDSSNPASWVCTEENLMLQIKTHDPLGIGLGDIWALRLLRAFLQWHPEDRITVEEALKHPYFHPSVQGTEDEKN